jgi:hypothetical protein
MYSIGSLGGTVLGARCADRRIRWAGNSTAKKWLFRSGCVTSSCSERVGILKRFGPCCLLATMPGDGLGTTMFSGHKHTNRALPINNKLCNQRWVDRCQQLHRMRLNNIKPAIGAYILLTLTPLRASSSLRHPPCSLGLPAAAVAIFRGCCGMDCGQQGQAWARGAGRLLRRAWLVGQLAASAVDCPADTGCTRSPPPQTTCRRAATSTCSKT